MERLDYRQIGAKSWRSLGLMAKSVDDGALDHGLLELVKLQQLIPVCLTVTV